MMYKTLVKISPTVLLLGIFLPPSFSPPRCRCCNVSGVWGEGKICNSNAVDDLNNALMLLTVNWGHSSL